MIVSPPGKYFGSKQSESFGQKPEQQAYGRAMNYCSARAATLAEIVQSAIKTKVHLFAEKELLGPLEIKDYKLHFTPMDIMNTAGGSEYMSRDFLKLIQLCLQEVMEGQATYICCLD